MARTPASAPGKWPVIKRYDADHLLRIAMPLGGIGTGTISLGGRGDLRDFEIVNRAAKGYTPATTFFAIHTRQGKSNISRLLEGPLDPTQYEGQMGCPVLNHGLPRFRNCEFRAGYPLGQVLLSDPELPVSVRLEAFNPLVPADPDASGLPVVMLRYVVTNRTAKPLTATVCGSLLNFIGTDGTDGAPKKNLNEFRGTGPASGIRGLFMRTEGIPNTSHLWGTMALATTADAGISHRTSWAQLSWGDSLLDFWDDLLDDGKLDDRTPPAADNPTGSLAVTQKLAPHESRAFTFLIAWHFPNRRNWHPAASPAGGGDAITAATPFAQTLRVSRFVPVPGSLDALQYPEDPASLGFETRKPTSNAVPGLFDLHSQIVERGGEKHEAVFLASRLRCPEAMRVDLLLGYDGPTKIWLDGKELFLDLKGTNPAEKDDLRLPLELTAGEHEILIALDTNRGHAWGVFLRYQRVGVSRKGVGAGTAVLPELVDEPAAAKPAAASAACCEGGSCAPTGDPDWVGNFYCTQYRDAWDAAERFAQNLGKLEAKTVEFVAAVADSDLPDVVKEAALFNVSTLRSQTCFRTADGYFFGWEGCNDKWGCCMGSCTHVWNYEQATPYLFGSLSRLAREAEFLYATTEQGLMNFRIQLPLRRALEWSLAAADGQMGTIMRLYRDWRLAGDPAMLKQLWPKAKKAIEFCWIPGGWDADQDGVMEGCQHNTMDVEYYGPNGQMGIWYLGALRASEEMAKAMGEGDFAARCRDLFERGRAWIDKHLFNGEFYEHEIRPPMDVSAIAPGLKHGTMGSQDLKDPVLQLGAACLVDQLVGQFLAHVCDLGYLVEPRNVRKTLASLMKYNFKTDMRSHFNHLRTFALGSESAMLMATYPRGRRPKRPFPYFNEVMTGFEYTAGVHMLYEGQEQDGLKVVKAIRDRYDGRRRSPFDEAECGHHYARAMASWAAILALTGFDYSGITRTMRFAAPAKSARWFWSTGYAWGVAEIGRAGGAAKVTLRVLFGSVAVSKLELRGLGEATLPEPNGKTLIAGDSVAFSIGTPGATAKKPATKKPAAKPKAGKKKPARAR